MLLETGQRSEKSKQGGACAQVPGGMRVPGQGLEAPHRKKATRRECLTNTEQGSESSTRPPHWERKLDRGAQGEKRRRGRSHGLSWECGISLRRTEVGS